MIVVASGATATEATASPPPGPVPSELSQPMSTSDQTSTGEAARPGGQRAEWAARETSLVQLLRWVGGSLLGCRRALRLFP